MDILVLKDEKVAEAAAEEKKCLFKCLCRITHKQEQHLVEDAKQSHRTVEKKKRKVKML